VPVGLSFEARKRFRGRVLVSFGEAVDVSSHLAVYRAEPAKALHTVTTGIRSAMEREVVHVERIDTAAFAHAMEVLYHGDVERELWEERGRSGRKIDRIPFSGSIAAAVEQVRTRDPAQLERSWQRMLGTVPDLPRTGAVTRRCGRASRGRRSRSRSRGPGRRSRRSRCSHTARP
jgi:hypothetical protein